MTALDAFGAWPLRCAFFTFCSLTPIPWTAEKRGEKRRWNEQRNANAQRNQNNNFRFFFLAKSHLEKCPVVGRLFVFRRFLIRNVVGSISLRFIGVCTKELKFLFRHFRFFHKFYLQFLLPFIVNLISTYSLCIDTTGRPWSRHRPQTPLTEK